MSKRLLAGAICAALLTAGANASAAIIEIEGQGTVSFLNTALNGNGVIANGDNFTFRVRYDDSIADSNADPDTGNYDNAILDYEIDIGGGSYIVTSAGSSVVIVDGAPGVLSDRAFFNNSQGDTISNSGPLSGFNFASSRVLIQDADSTGLTSDVLAGIVFDPTIFNNSIMQLFFAGVDGVGVGGNIETFSFTDVTPEVPLPAAAPLLLLGLGAGGLLARRRKA